MKRILMYMLALIAFSELYSQGLYNNGAKIVVSSGAYLNVSGGNLGDFTNASNITDGAISLDGTLKIEGDVTNNVSTADMIVYSSPTSSVILCGSTLQLLKGSTSKVLTFNSLKIDNTSGVKLLKNVTVNNNLTLTNGILNITDEILTFGTTASITGTFSSANMIQADNTGTVRKLTANTGSFLFPVGSNKSTPIYTPVTLNFTSGTFSNGAYSAVNLTPQMYSFSGIHGSYLKRYWNVSQSGITGFNANAAFNYDPTDVVGTESLIYGDKFAAAPDTIFSPTNTTLHQFATNGLTSFGTFTGAYLTKVINLSLLLEGLYNGAGTMRQARDAAGPNWPAGIADHITVELHNSATYATTVYSAVDVPLNTNGTASLEIPAIYKSNYYLTVKHRNSIETTSSAALSFLGSTINQSYLVPANVFGGNVGLSIDNHYLIFSGDANQDGIIDTSDMTLVNNDSFNFNGGYLTTDINGDGIIDTSDMTIINNNSFNFVGTSHP